MRSRYYTDAKPSTRIKKKLRGGGRKESGRVGKRLKEGRVETDKKNDESLMLAILLYLSTLY